MTRDEIVSWFDRRLHALNAHDPVALAEFYAEDCSIDSPTAGRVTSGVDAAVGIDRAWINGFPDVTFTTSMLLIDGNRLAWVGTAAGTDRGGFMGLPATDKKFAVPMVLFTKLRDGKITRERRVYGFTRMLMQIGILKARADAGDTSAELSAPADLARGVIGTAPHDTDVGALVRRHGVAFARRDVDALAALHADDCVMESHLAGRIEGPAAIAQVYRRWFGSLPDGNFESEEAIIDGGSAVEIALMTGTDRGGFFGFAPTNRPVRVRTAWLFAARGRQFSYVRPIYDFTGMLVQMGLVKPKPM
jgi:steroid delta-isomerase-like uncharacterized protein